MSKVLKASIILIFAFMMACTSNAYASFNASPFEIDLQVREGVSYNSNPAYDIRSREKSSWGSKLGETVTIQLPFGGTHRYTLLNNTDWTYYFNNNAFSHVNSNTVQSLDLIFSKWSFNLHQGFNISSTPTTEQLGIVESDLFKSVSPSAGIAATGDLGKLTLRTGFDYSYKSYNQDYDLLDQDSYIAFADAGFEVMPVLDVFTRYTADMTKRRKDTMNDSFGNSIIGGVRGDITPYLVGEVGAGYSWYDFKKTDTAPDESDYSNMIYSGSLTNRLSRLTTQKVTFSLSPQQGYTQGHDYYKSYVTKYTITHELNDRINLNGIAAYINNAEGGAAETKEKSEIYQIGGGIKYFIAKYATLGISYDFAYKDSNLHGKDYRQHEAVVQLIHNF
ncbi:MAG: outer membrane beta-barrel protein [Candidatus Omnitrophota bacterium]